MIDAVAGRKIDLHFFASVLVVLAATVAAAVVGLAVGQTVADRPDPAPAVAPRVSMKVGVTPDPVQTLDRATIETKFETSAEIPELLRAELEVRDSTGKRVLSMVQSGFRVPAEGARALQWEWRVPGDLASGSYTLGVKLIGMESGKVYREEDRAATMAVEHYR